MLQRWISFFKSHVLCACFNMPVILYSPIKKRSRGFRSTRSRLPILTTKTESTWPGNVCCSHWNVTRTAWLVWNHILVISIYSNCGKNNWVIMPWYRTAVTVFDQPLIFQNISVQLCLQHKIHTKRRSVMTKLPAVDLFFRFVETGLEKWQQI